MILARQEHEKRAIKAGKLDAAIVDRKSWGWPYLPGCCCERSEILTRRGFIGVKDMREDDIFATRDKDGYFEWQAATHITRSRYRGKMVRLLGTHLDQLLTPNHRSLIRDRHYKGRKMSSVASHEYITTASDIHTNDVTAKSRWVGCQIYDVPLTAHPGRRHGIRREERILSTILKSRLDRTKDAHIDWEVWIQFLALYLADGCCDGTLEGIDFYSGVPPYAQHFAAWKKLKADFDADPLEVASRNTYSPYRVRIACHEDSPIRAEVAELLAQMPMAWTPSRQGFACGSKPLWLALFPFGNSYTKFVPDEIKNLDTSELSLFLSWLKKTDGYHAKDGEYGEYTTVSPRLAEDVCALFVRLGYAVNVARVPQESGATATRIHFSFKEYCLISETAEEEYDGYVYCPTVPNGIICIRRNGKVSWTGNSVQRLSIPVIKSTPYNLRRMSRTPVPRRAFNLIKGALISLPFTVQPIEGVEPIDSEEEQKERIRIAKKIFDHPNNVDSFQTFIEQGVEDMVLLGGFVAEMQLTLDPERPLKMWPVNIESVRIFVSWKESTPDMPHYAQMTGLLGERGAVLFYDDEMLYIKDNPSTDNPFGLGKMEIAFMSVNYLLGVQDMAGRAGTDQVHKCFPDWTEVLTRRGWIPWREAGEDDEFATRNDAGEFQWQRPLGFVREWHDGDLIQFRSRSLKMTVTPHHRMYGTRIYRGKQGRAALGFIPANKLEAAVADRPGGTQGGRREKPHNVLKDFKVPATSIWKGTLASKQFQLGARLFDWEDWAAFLGIWMAEGSCLGCGLTVPPKGEYRIQIAQSRRANRAKYKKIESLLKRLGVHYHSKRDRILFTDREIWGYLSRFGDSYNKHVPRWVKDAPASIISVFVDWAMLGDGTQRQSGKRIYYTASKRLADDMQELLQKIGSSGAIHQVLQDSGLIYRVEEMLRSEISIVPDGGGRRGKDRIPRRVNYSGMVYCAMVPNGTLYCRENGYPFWSGNTFLWWEAPQSEAHIQIVRRHIQNELEGQAKLSIITGMKKPDPVEVTPVSEADLLLNWQEMLIRMIANGFDMTAMSLGVEHDVNRAVGEVLADGDFRSAVVPMGRRLQEGFTRKILHQKLGWTDLEAAFLNLDDPDTQTKVEMYGRLFSMNAITPKEIREGLGMKDLDRPILELTQFEMMLLNAEAAAKLQDQNQANALDRQMGMQQKMAALQPPTLPSTDIPPSEEEQPGGGNRFGNTPSAAAPTPGGGGGGKISAPKPISTPKFPIAGSKYNARQIAQMPVNELSDVYRATGFRASEFLKAMDEQEPGILQELTDEVKTFFQQILDEEKKDKARLRLSPRTLKQWQKELAVKVRKQNKRTSDMAQYLQDLGSKKKQIYRKTVGSTPYSKAGKPGKPGKGTYPTTL
ncbi:MAG: phage portal protein [Patescibacteria group bacterium]|nr:phage portal protein [Patescibacteria group bacterium]